MTVNNFAFTPADGLRNAVSFPTSPVSEADARNQPQTLLDQLRDYINTTIIAELNNKLALAGGNLTGDLSVTGTVTTSGTLTGSALIPTGLTGATQASRYVGATVSGAPTTGTFNKTDWCLDATGTIWICTVAGTPGTWVKPTTVGVTSLSGGSKIQSGSIAATAVGDYTVTFPVAFGGAPIVTSQYFSNGAGSTAATNITIVSTTQVTFHVGSSNAGATIHWHAIGA